MNPQAEAAGPKNTGAPPVNWGKRLSDMVGNSLEKTLKHSGRILQHRKNQTYMLGNTAKYIHQSADFTSLMSDIAIEGIGDYVKIMEGQVLILRRMTRNGTVDPRVISRFVEIVGVKSEINTTNLNIIRNSLVRFMHTDTKSSINSVVVQNQNNSENKSQEEDGSLTKVAYEICPDAVAGCDAHGT